MKINSMSLNQVSHNVASATTSSLDIETKNIMNQITSRRQSLKRLSSDSEMSAEEKAKERQEIQKQIAELNRKLRMLRMEKKEEMEKSEKEQEQKQKITVAEEENKKEVFKIETEKSSSVKEIEKQQEKNNISPQNIQKILGAGTAVQRERIQQNVEQGEKSVQNILEAEIKMDKLYGTDTTVKKEKLYSLIEVGKKKVEIEEKPQKQSGNLQKNPVKIVFRDDEID